MHKKIICPYHDEQTPSCVLYPDSYYCFGCGAHGPLSDLGEGYENARIPPKPKEDISKTMAYIQALPVKEIRGLMLPYDESAYYIVWPNQEYYAKRLFSPSERGSKYIYPSGHSVQPYIFNSGTKTLILVEGQINAISLTQVYKNYTVVSLGGTSSFSEKMLLPILKDNYDRCHVFVDNDAAGAKAVLESKPIITKWVKLCKYNLIDNDFNDILVKYGTEGLREFVEKRMAM